VNDSWKNDLSPIGAVVAKPIDQATLKADTNPLTWRAITPRAASCTSCHDSQTAISHVVSVGGSSFGNASHAQALQMQETCADCHGPGRPQGVDAVHK
jgi:OmcA/MtrC family decaheme c-type cytochrome